MLFSLCLFEVEFTSPLYYALLEFNIFVKHLWKREGLRLAVYYNEHIYRAGILKLSVFIKLI